MIYIKKRNGRRTKFDSKKIEDAVLRAFVAVDKEETEYAKQKASNIANYIEDVVSKSTKMLSVEDIQDMVQKGLMSTKRDDVATAFVQYRLLRTMARSQYDELWDAISEKLEAKNVQNQNANVDEKSFGGRVGEASSVVTKKYALDFIVSQMARDNHLNNEIYIHDLDSYSTGMHNCLTLPFDDLLANGFNTRQTDVRPANSINTAFQLVAVLFQLQSLQQFGGVSASHLDWTMVPYVRKSFYKHYNDVLTVLPFLSPINLTDRQIESTEIDNALYKGRHWWNFIKRYIYKHALRKVTKEIYQAAEGMYHNLNTLQSRSGNQLPFTSINYGTCTKPEGRLVIKALLDVSIKGIGKLHKTSIFPCGIFQCMKGVNLEEGDVNYDLFKLALESTSKRLYPNYANVDWSGNSGYDINDPKTYFSTMGCRTANGYDINHEKGQNPQLKDGRGNICPVTIIMPTLAMEAREVYEVSRNNNLVDIFLGILDKKIHEAKDMLIERFEWICDQDASSAKFMYENNTMFGYKPNEGIRSALKHGTLAIGQLGLAETLQILIGKDHTAKEGMELAKRIEKLFADRCAEFKKTYKLNFGVYYTPAENLCKTAMVKFKNKYGIIDGVSDKEYFTNSIHVPVYHKLSPFEKIEIESQLTGYSSAGCITYVELDSSIKNNITALEKIVKYAMEKDIPYFAVNVPNDTCLDCGFMGEFNSRCPICNSSNIQQLRRVTGYLTGNYTTAFNSGKIAETNARVKHDGMVNYNA